MESPGAFIGRWKILKVGVSRKIKKQPDKGDVVKFHKGTRPGGCG
jgi:hypothetical protein